MRWVQQKLAGEVTDEEKKAGNLEVNQKPDQIMDDDFSPEFLDPEQLQMMKGHGLQMTLSQMSSGQGAKYNGQNDVQMLSQTT